jgi:serine phosphatase RsbU (regulator of sigma subunit)
MAVLREIGGVQQYTLRDPVTVIGRATGCDIVVRIAKVSARHAMIVRQGQSFFLDDLASSNGTFINGQRVKGRTQLRNNDRLDLFGLVLEFFDADAPPSSTTLKAQPAFTLRDAPEGAEPAPVMSTLALSETGRVGIAPEAKLRAVLELARNLSTTLDQKEVLPKILESLFSIFPQADRGFILLRDPASHKLIPKAIRHRRPDGIESPSISRTIVDHAMQTGQALLSADAGHDERFDPSQSIRRHRICSIMCVPMISQGGESLGVIQLDTQTSRTPFSQDDLDVLVTASMQAARSVEMARLHRERRDLEAATAIQKSFLPGERPRVPGLHFFDAYTSAQQVGGDYYDYVALPGQRLVVAIGDVAGKGVPAALLMAKLSAEVRFCLATEPSLSAAVSKLNSSLKRACEEGRFVTFLGMVLDLEKMSVTMVNAGHLPPLRRCGATGEVDVIGENDVGIPLGVFDRPYQETTLDLGVGDCLVLATDGITEARNPDNDLYGVERLRAIMQKSPPEAGSIGASVLADVRSFAGGRPLGDDLTLIVMGREQFVRTEIEMPPLS